MWNDESAERLGATIRRKRTESNLSQESLAYQSGITKNQLQLIESGRASGRKEEAGPSNPRMATLSGLAATLDTSVADLLKDARI